MNEIPKCVKEYQCSGCMLAPPDCYKPADNIACDSHTAGTMVVPGGSIFLGLPKGFNRIGPMAKEHHKIYIWDSLDKGWRYDKFNVPVWKHLNESGHTIVRVYQPRLNTTAIHIFLGNYMADIDAVEITERDISEMD